MNSFSMYGLILGAMIMMIGCNPETSSETKSTTSTANTQVEKNKQDLIPNEIKHCTWGDYDAYSFVETSTPIGDLNVCRSTRHPQDIYVQLATPEANVQICIFPAAHGNNIVFPIGQDQCQLFSDNKRIYRFQLTPDSRYVSAGQNGVILVKNEQATFGAPYSAKLFAPFAVAKCGFEYLKNQDTSYCDALMDSNVFFFKAL